MNDDRLWLISKQTSARFQQLRRLVQRTLRKNDTGRVDHLTVNSRLDGLDEKFRILNNDTLADALCMRLEELDGKRYSYSPETLFLLLELSDRPATHANIEEVNNLFQPPPSPKPLTWADIYASDPITEEEKGIWQDIDYGAPSSDDEDDDVSSLSSDVSIPRIVPQRPTEPTDEYVIPDELLTYVEDEDLFTRIHNTHIIIEELPETAHGSTLTELQVVRETLFMLRGLPTSLFPLIGKTIMIDPKFRLSHASITVFSSLLESFRTIGTCVHVIRSFIKSKRSVPFQQKFQREMESCLWQFDMKVSNLEAQYAAPANESVVSLAELHSKIETNASLLLDLSCLINRMDSNKEAGEFYCLDLLYDLVCSKQATGEYDDFKYLAEIFLKCFEIYIRPVRLWMESGRLDENLGSFFVSESTSTKDLRGLWGEWFILEEKSGQLYAPKFLRFGAKKIFTTGKSVVFLHHLGVLSPNHDDSPVSPESLLETLCPSTLDVTLLPFSALLESSFDQLINTNHALASTALRKQLDEKCGLWLSLDALDHIYLAKNLSLSSRIDHHVFDLIDRRVQSWNNRFRLTDVAQSAFVGIECIEPRRLTIRSKQLSPELFSKYHRSVQLLKALSIDYMLPWPVGNILPRRSIRTHRRIAVLLMQIRRARYAIERLPLRALIPANEQSDRHNAVLAMYNRLNLTWFLTVFYDHLVNRVIAVSTSSMRQSLAQANDADAMIDVYASFTNSLEAQCLLCPSLAHLHRAVMSLLDLCIYFSDLQLVYRSEKQTENNPDGAAGQHLHHGKRPDHDAASDEDETAEEAEDNEDTPEKAILADDDGNALEAVYRKRLGQIRQRFGQQCSILADGLQNLDSADRWPSWDVLVEKLDYRRGTSRA